MMILFFAAIAQACNISVEILPLCADNDNIAGFGGWGPHLRGLMRISQKVFFGTNVFANGFNKQIKIYSSSQGAWQLERTIDHLTEGGCSQKDAFVATGSTIWTYNINVLARKIEECSFDVAFGSVRLPAVF